LHLTPSQLPQCRTTEPRDEEKCRRVLVYRGGFFFPITRTIGTLHRGLVWAVSIVSTVDFQGSLSHSLNFVSVARPRCSGSSRRISTPCLARTHSTNFGGDFQHHLAFPYVHQICRSKRPCARAQSEKRKTNHHSHGPFCSSQEPHYELSFAGNPCVTWGCLEWMQTV
jgi:hypothetical protein